jgi:hypothetical protein
MMATISSLAGPYVGDAVGTDVGYEVGALVVMFFGTPKSINLYLEYCYDHYSNLACLKAFQIQ